MNKHEKFLLKSEIVLRMAVKVSGNFTSRDNVCQFEEQLTSEEYQLCTDFFDFLHENGYTFGSGNYAQRVKQFIDQS